jgi:hypothetical protein
MEVKRTRLSLSLQLLTRKRCVGRRMHDAGNTHAGWWVSSKKSPNPSRARSRVPGLATVAANAGGILHA